MYWMLSSVAISQALILRAYGTGLKMRAHALVGVADADCMALRRFFSTALFCLLLVNCSYGYSEQPSAPPRQAARPSAANPPPQVPDIGPPRIVSAGRRLECVAYARSLSGIDIKGDAWTWWGRASGRYARGRTPQPGAVLVLGRKGRSLGHLAVVVRVINSREVVARHANWLNRGQIHLDTPIRDVSRNNDWSAVRVWYTPGRVMGRSTYPAYGFIYPARPGGVATR